MAVTLPYPTLGPGIVDAAEINANFSALVTAMTNIGNENIRSGAAISIDKNSASYEYMNVSVVLAGGSASNDTLVPIYNDSKGNWTVVSTQWATDDTGAPTGVIGIQWGVLDGTATDTIANNFSSTATVDSVALVGANISSQGIDSSPTTTTLTFGGGGVYRCLRFYMSTTDAAATAPIHITLLLKRQIAT